VIAPEAANAAALAALTRRIDPRRHSGASLAGRPKPAPQVLDRPGPTADLLPQRRPGPGLGRRLRAFRTSRGISQVALATRAGLDHSYISRIESGDRVPPPDALDAITRALALTGKQALGLFLDTYVPDRLHRYLED
jgi:ribosome-binding protein aMBF1 (putative translation factor)